jgi:hypothetical protein
MRKPETRNSACIFIRHSEFEFRHSFQWVERRSNPRLLVFSQALNRLSYRPSFELQISDLLIAERERNEKGPRSGTAGLWMLKRQAKMLGCHKRGVKECDRTNRAAAKEKRLWRVSRRMVVLGNRGFERKANCHFRPMSQKTRISRIGFALIRRAPGQVPERCSPQPDYSHKGAAVRKYSREFLNFPNLTQPTGRN